MIKFRFTYFLYFVIVLSANTAFAQEEEGSAQLNEDLGTVTDDFQENFFEALKQKGIENYELALNALDKAERAAKGNTENVAVVTFERGKNLAALERFDDAEAEYKKVLASKGENLDILQALYDVYYQKRDYQAAIPLVQKLMKFDDDYKEDLANLYHRTEQYDKALEVLDDLDESWGESVYRNALRRQIYQVTGDTEGAISNLEEKIEKNPKKEQDYLNLIYLYSEEGNTEKAFATAQELLKNQPNSKLAHLALYKFYLDKNETENALQSMDVVFAADEIDAESKYKVLGDFIGFVNENPQYEAKLKDVVSNFSTENSGKVYQQLGDYYLAKNQKENALQFYELGIAQDPDNYNLLKNTLLLQLDSKKYETAANLSASGLEIFPAQSLLYLMNGVANIGLSKADKAIESLEMGVDFLLDDPKMEKDFYNQLSKAYQLKGDTANAKKFEDKAAQINAAN